MALTHARSDRAVDRTPRSPANVSMTVATGAHPVPTALAALAATLLSLAQRRLSTRARSIRRRAVAVSGEIVYVDGSREAIDTSSLIGAPEGALSILWLVPHHTCFQWDLPGQSSWGIQCPVWRTNLRRPWQEEELRAHAEAFTTAEIKSGDFESAVTGAGAGDFVYLDPPYTVTHSNNGFVRYNDRIFSWKDQQRLANVAQSLSRSGSTVVVSNAFHPSILDLYPSFHAISVARSSVMAAKAGRRGPIQELVLTNAPIPEQGRT
jgi:D12 class N6 adenine-specific DNA methyltransferase